MLFNDPKYIIFFLTIFLLYWSLQRRQQNILLLTGSYFFYGCWNVKLVPLVFFVSLSAYLSAHFIARTSSVFYRKTAVVLALIVNFTPLVIFKYYDFFVISFVDFISFFGISVSPLLLSVVLPVGISFYTFQAASYIVDVYRKKTSTDIHIIDFLLYISFFPQLVAGPIERASHILPQFLRSRNMSWQDVSTGLLFISYGIFKKIVVADTLASYVDVSYSNLASVSGLQLTIATLFFSIQIYCDFSGYCDIAIGSARLLGFRLSQNFVFPYFSLNTAEFWRRWHVTLMSWFRDYVYIPLGGGRCGAVRKLINILLVFFVSGLWHGANFTFVIWGLLNGIFVIAYLRLAPIFQEVRKHINRYVHVIFSVTLTYFLICVSWVFFRADSVDDATAIFTKIITIHSLDFDINGQFVRAAFVYVGFIVLEFIVYMVRYHYLVEIRSRWFVYGTSFSLILVTLLFGTFQHVPFIYFQF